MMVYILYNGYEALDESPQLHIGFSKSEIYTNDSYQQLLKRVSFRFSNFPKASSFSMV